MNFKEFCKGLNRMFDECPDEDNPFIDVAHSEYTEDWIAWAIAHPDEAEGFVTTWVKEHPAPIYPTFGEYLSSMAAHDPSLNKISLQKLLDTPITERIADYYHITPLNLCGVNKYAQSDWW